jgi:two-component system, OmpR family, response regulator PhoP
MYVASKPEASERLPSIAVVEDNQDFREEVLVPALRRAGFEVVGMAGALELYRAMTTRSFDLVLLDVALPDENGFSIASHLRSLSSTLGIVMLTGYDTSENQVRGLMAGADVYLFKPPDMEVVVNTLRNLARRIVPNAATLAPEPTAWRLGEQGWIIESPTGVEIKMNQDEQELMTMLAESVGKPVDRETLMTRLSRGAYEFDLHRLEMLVYRLRKKCLKLAKEDLPLHAVRGVGYVLHW